MCGGYHTRSLKESEMLTLTPEGSKMTSPTVTKNEGGVITRERRKSSLIVPSGFEESPFAKPQISMKKPHVYSRSNSVLKRESAEIIQQLQERKGMNLSATSARLSMVNSIENNPTTPSRQKRQSILPSISEDRKDQSQVLSKLRKQRENSLANANDFRRSSHNIKANLMSNSNIKNKHVELSDRYLDLAAKHIGKHSILPGKMMNDYKSQLHILEKDGINRTDEELEKLSVMMRKLAPSFFKKFQNNIIFELCRIMKFMIVPKGNIIFKEGDIGDLVYIVASGRIEIKAKEKDKEQKDNTKLSARLHRGDTFGELALMHKEKCYRSSTVIATTKCELVTLDKEGFNKVYEATHGSTVNDIMEFVGSTQAFRNCNMDNLRTIAPYFAQEVFRHGKIFDLDKLDKIYIVVEGELSVMQDCNEPRSQPLPSKYGVGAPATSPSNGNKGKMKVKTFKSRRISECIDDILDGISEHRNMMSLLNDDQEEQPTLNYKTRGYSKTRSFKANSNGDQNHSIPQTRLSMKDSISENVMGKIGPKLLFGYSSILSEMKRGWYGKVTSGQLRTYSIDISVFLATVDPAVVATIKKEEIFKVQYFESALLERQKATKKLVDKRPSLANYVGKRV